ncbi:hypothetical protein PO002_04220 [Cupriavidus necator]|uniref:hypothetical protein n=1 Tax=Cupriavidus necator TaxID=106590 RepID=UPI0039C0C470
MNGVPFFSCATLRIFARISAFSRIPQRIPLCLPDLNSWPRERDAIRASAPECPMHFRAPFPFLP